MLADYGLLPKGQASRSSDLISAAATAETVPTPSRSSVPGLSGWVSECSAQTRKLPQGMAVMGIKYGNIA